jgi:hypothetical protein
LLRFWRLRTYYATLSRRPLLGSITNYDHMARSICSSVFVHWYLIYSTSCFLLPYHDRYLDKPYLLSIAYLPTSLRLERRPSLYFSILLSVLSVYRLHSYPNVFSLAVFTTFYSCFDHRSFPRSLSLNIRRYSLGRAYAINHSLYIQ